MGELKDWLTMIGALSSAAIGALILYQLKRGDRRAERNKVLREKLEAAFELCGSLVDKCETNYQMLGGQVGVEGVGPPTLVEIPMTEAHRLGMLIWIYFRDLEPVHREASTAHNDFIIVLREVNAKSLTGDADAKLAYQTKLVPAMGKLRPAYDKLLTVLADRALALI
jgi:hypothetical protein